MKLKTLYLFFGFLSANAVFAGDELADGMTAYNASDYATAEQQFRTAALRGEAEAQWRLGLMLANGRGMPRDDAAAVLWYRKAAEQDNMQAQYLLAYMYESGRGVAQNDASAVLWYRKAALQGNAHAQYGVRGAMEQ